MDISWNQKEGASVLRSCCILQSQRQWSFRNSCFHALRLPRVPSLLLSASLCHCRRIFLILSLPTFHSTWVYEAWMFRIQFLGKKLKLNSVWVCYPTVAGGRGTADKCGCYCANSADVGDEAAPGKEDEKIKRQAFSRPLFQVNPQTWTWIVISPLHW